MRRPSYKVILTPDEMYMGAVAGILRHIENIGSGKPPRHGIKPDEKDWQAHIEGALGEMALAKFLGIYWGGKGSMTNPDVGAHQVRATTHTSGHLLLHESDKPYEEFWLITGFNGKYVVRGWLQARDGQKRKYWCDLTGKNRPAFFVPQSDLRSPDDYFSKPKKSPQ